MIYQNISCDADRVDLQNNLSVLNDFCISWPIPFNLSETEMTSFINRISPIKSTYTIEKQPVELTTD